MRIVLVFIYSICLACAPSKKEGPADSPELPNVVLIYADDMGYGEIHALNPERSRIPTPNLDQLVKAGKVFTDAHTTSSVCTPSRYALLTGRYNWRSRLQQGVVTGGNEPLISAERLTLPALFKKQGYHTAMVGKWHLEYEYDVPEDLKDVPLSKVDDFFLPASYPIGSKIIGGPITRGFETFYGFHHSREMSSIVRNDVIEKEIDVIDVLPSLTQEVVDIIDEKAISAKNGEPFFIYFAQNSPHTPIAPSKEWQGKTDLGSYGDFVAQTDGSVGAVLEALDKNGLTNNTIVIFSTDNGTSRAAKIRELQSKGHFSSAQFRGSKADIWDGGHRVPFIVRWPGVANPGSKSSQLICLSDLMATFAEFFGFILPENSAEDSWSFLPALKQEDIESPRKSVVHHSVSGRFAVREGDWKLILAPGSGGWTAPNDIAASKQGMPDIQLYNMSTDIAEEQNLFESEAEKVESMIALLQKMVADGRSTPGKAQSNDAEIDIFKTHKNVSKGAKD